jgi:hypothetical protein
LAIAWIASIALAASMLSSFHADQAPIRDRDTGHVALAPSLGLRHGEWWVETEITGLEGALDLLEETLQRGMDIRRQILRRRHAKSRLEAPCHGAFIRREHTGGQKAVQGRFRLQRVQGMINQCSKGCIHLRHGHSLVRRGITMVDPRPAPE